MQTDLEFIKSYVFIKDSDFNSDIRSSTVGAPRGKETIADRLLARAPSHSIIEYIAPIGVVNVSIREPPKAPKLRIV